MALTFIRHYVLSFIQQKIHADVFSFHTCYLRLGIRSSKLDKSLARNFFIVDLLLSATSLFYRL